MNTITVSQIFEANQVLTLAIAKTLIGKTIAITNPEYKKNMADVRTFKLVGIESEYDLAAKQECEGYANRQEYWNDKLSYRIENFKKRLQLVGEGDISYATCELGNGYFTEDTFFGSDADREIYFIEVR